MMSDWDSPVIATLPHPLSSPSPSLSSDCHRQLVLSCSRHKYAIVWGWVMGVGGSETLSIGVTGNMFNGASAVGVI